MLSLIRKLFCTLTIVPVMTGCVSDGGKKPGSGDPSAAELSSPQGFSGPFSGDQLNYKKGSGVSGETIWALAQCNCFPGLFKTFMEKTATGKGVLPQILVPTVREEIKGNTALQTLQKIPLGGLLADFFASDEKLADKVREGLAQKLALAPGGSTLGTRMTFRFDGFTPESGKKETFSVSEQIPRWMGVFSADGIWSDAAKVDGSDHGLQALELLRTLSEWKYMIGLDANSDGGFYGGLTLRADNGGTVMNGPVDPRKSNGADWFISGSYSLKYDDKNARELATSVKEVWSHNNEAVALDEQARLWHAAARAFSRLRPENRKALGSLFGSGADAVLPPETHTLPLAFLGGIKTLLPEAFIDRDGRLIREFADFDGKEDKPAGLITMARLIRALTAWSVALRTADKAGLDKETLQKVSAAPEELKPAIQLAVQTILMNHTVPATDQGGSYGLALIEGGSTVDVASASEVLLALTEVEGDLLESDFLRERVLQLFDWYGGDLLQKSADISDRELIWIRTAADAAQRYAGERTQSWAQDAASFADKLLQKGSL